MEDAGMGGFGGLFGKRPPEPARPEPMEGLTTDPCLGDSKVHEWHVRLAHGDDAGFRDYLASEPDRDRRDFTLVAVFDSLPDRAAWADQWVDEEPSNPLAHIVRGVNLVAWAWKARTRLRASEVSPEQFNQFFPRLELAWRDFEAAIGLPPDDGSGYGLSLDAARGLQLGNERALEIYRAAQERRPWQPTAHRSLLQSLAPKWSHSTAEMWDFARSVTQNAPIGSAVHAVIPDAHVETWIETKGPEKDAYWRSPAVRAEIVDAATRSIDIPTADFSLPMMRARSSFAYCFAFVGERERARREFRILGPVVGGPFMFSADPLHMASEFRRWAAKG
jgi:hypothetical protein